MILRGKYSHCMIIKTIKNHKKKIMYFVLLPVLSTISILKWNPKNSISQKSSTTRLLLSPITLCPKIWRNCIRSPSFITMLISIRRILCLGRLSIKWGNSLRLWPIRVGIRWWRMSNIVCGWCFLKCSRIGLKSGQDLEWLLCKCLPMQLCILNDLILFLNFQINTNNKVADYPGVLHVVNFLIKNGDF